MPKYFAKINNKIVETVIVVDSQKWCEDNLGGTWVETFMDARERKQYAGPGSNYDQTSDKFYSAKPFPSWTLDNNLDWQPPKVKPDDTYRWDEDTQEWKKRTDL